MTQEARVAAGWACNAASDASHQALQHSREYAVPRPTIPIIVALLAASTAGAVGAATVHGCLSIVEDAVRAAGCRGRGRGWGHADAALARPASAVPGTDTFEAVGARSVACATPAVDICSKHRQDGAAMLGVVQQPRGLKQHYCCQQNGDHMCTV